MAPSTAEYLMHLLIPLPFIGLSVLYFILTFVLNPLLPLTNFSSYKEKTFARFWLAFGPALSAHVPAALPRLLAQSRGIVLDIGPGSGEQLHHFSRPENITAIYGVEPGVSLHERLRAAAEKVGLGRKYHVLGATADLESIVPCLVKQGLIKPKQTSEGDLELFDEITCIRVLCGVPNQPGTIADLYSLLKPGGRFVMCEHVRNKTDTLAGIAQKLYMILGWGALMGGCDMMRDTLSELTKVAKEKDGGWEKIEVEEVDDFSPSVHVVGVLTKKRK
ncbi:uncharacterized protein Z518_05882 [Rhinocladiella mackenziei CBS 650.93]|uniref:Phospholipid methyltransferase n=1 Tax=Rhinocladiella mackenziei CBS 650.93 TaxID=1442369 RepID=A0A0D2J7K6_9EURO|nr:uncharacterized protein Z518_05882 [Rhinocladiella mackenziei CBS 650.93]KIX05010.1 hypothetical protein Z518_05882 [Rhinocladiella mackenziei CBS 650.93]